MRKTLVTALGTLAALALAVPARAGGGTAPRFVVFEAFMRHG